MRPRIRPFEDRGVGAVVDLSLRAWAPVFESVEWVLGLEIFGRPAVMIRCRNVQDG